jgi:hypothetical protein
MSQVSQHAYYTLGNGAYYEVGNREHRVVAPDFTIRATSYASTGWLCLSCSLSLLRHLFDRSLQLILPCPMGMKKVHTLEILEGACINWLTSLYAPIRLLALALLGFLV